MILPSFKLSGLWSGKHIFCVRGHSITTKTKRWIGSESIVYAYIELNDQFLYYFQTTSSRLLILFFRCCCCIVAAIFTFLVLKSIYLSILLCSKMSMLEQNCPNQIKIVKFGSNLSNSGSNLSKYGSNLSKIDQNCSEWMKLVQIGYYLSKLQTYI